MSSGKVVTDAHIDEVCEKIKVLLLKAYALYSDGMTKDGDEAVAEADALFEGLCNEIKETWGE